MYPITGEQVRAARAYLEWSQERMATKAGLAINTIRNIEMGFISPRHDTYDIIRQVIENAGLEFTENEGVRRRDDDVRIFRGVDSCDRFYDDLLKSTRKRGGEVCIAIRSQGLLARLLDMPKPDGKKLAELCAAIPVKCLLAEMPDPSLIVPGCEMRVTVKQHISPMPLCIYGGKYAHAVIDEEKHPRFAVFGIASVAADFTLHFQMLWDSAAPIPLPR